MGLHTKMISAGTGPFRLEAAVTVMPRGITVTACSPDYAHLGATAQAIPRPEEDRTATVSILSVPCHRDEIPAHDIAAALATRFRVPVAASTGFHVDCATREDIDTFLSTTQELIENIAVYVEHVRRATWETEEDVVAVEPDGSVVGPVPRRLAHEGEGILHQAFLTFLVEGAGESARVLLCRRSPLKRLWGGVLADTCAGHPLAGEGLAHAATRRLEEECGLSPEQAPLSQLGHIVYREDHGDGRCECEWCAVFAGRLVSGTQPRVNEEEISEIRRVSFAELEGYREGRPEQLAPWAALALRDPQVWSALQELTGA